ncbi:MAG TPA: sulfite reductase subunit alpha [Alphaproteobacteria bacterium]|nr:sulfite reductase subunit alpha [Alphaproteobacteria bacterium]
MTDQAQPPLVELIPATAPFTPAQRAWLNGFFNGLMSAEAKAAPNSTAPAAPTPGAAPGDGDDGEAPWHDQTLRLDDRMKLAQGRPLRRRMMAAMAQQDCGQCGYNCADYADALFLKKEGRLNLCVPGGKETARALKTLYGEMGAVPAAAAAPASAAATEPAAPGYSRDNPVESTLLARRRLNKPGSEKDTWHVEFDLGENGLVYAPGDSFGVYPTNDPSLVASVIAALGAAPETPVGDKTLAETLAASVSLGTAPDALFQLFSYLAGGKTRQKALMLAKGEDPDGDAASLDVLAALEKFAACRPSAEAFIEALEPLQPRLYSIASSLKTEPGKVALTIDAVRYRVGARERLGVASTFCIDRLAPGARLRTYVQKAHGFGLPADPAVPIIMIGPGTGVAPFRAFLHERKATGAGGRNWLFFGHQHRAFDFFYEEEFAAMQAAGLLTRLTLAWSRDDTAKIYVQDRMREVRQDLWAWIAEGAHIYVCGDAKRMAKDVENALVEIVAACGMRSANEAVAFVAGLKKSGRYQADVY